MKEGDRGAEKKRDRSVRRRMGLFDFSRVEGDSACLMWMETGSTLGGMGVLCAN
jgi:hypothetical protein